MTLLGELVAEILVDEGVDGDGSLTLALALLTLRTALPLFLHPRLPFLLLLTVVGNPVEQGAQVLRLEGKYGGFGKDGAAAHVYEGGVLRVAFHVRDP